MTGALGERSKRMFQSLDDADCYNSLSLDYWLFLKMYGVQIPVKIISIAHTVSINGSSGFNTISHFLRFSSIPGLDCYLNFFFLKSYGLLAIDFSELHLKSVELTLTKGQIFFPSLLGKFPLIK